MGVEATWTKEEEAAQGSMATIVETAKVVVPDSDFEIFRLRALGRSTRIDPGGGFEHRCDYPETANCRVFA